MKELFIDRENAPVREGATLFECAEAVGVRVPTSCVKQGKCRECLLEIEAGEELLSPRTSHETHLGEGFRLACRTRILGEGTVRCHTLRRGSMRILDEASGLPQRADRGPGLALDPPCPRGYGIAVDLGTTTVAMRLYDLATGRLVASQVFENPQRFGGSDVMARIHFDTHQKGRLLQRTLFGYLGRAIERFPVETEEIVEIVVAANTTMRDLFFGLDVHSIGQKPYRSITEHEYRDGKRNTTSLLADAKRLKLKLALAPGARVYGLPLLGSHVGADAAAGLLASGIAERSEVSMLMDIGTNTELILGNRDRVVAASCPAGPAFEGGGVLCGMPALEGAIERVSIREDGTPETRTIGDGTPEGICGSGLVDLLSELVRTGRMNAQGRFAEGLERLLLAPGIVFTEADVNELAQGKGANVAGLRIVSDIYGIDLEDVDRFYLAGGFARHIDVDAARRIGLLPQLPDEKVVLVGNASLEGASRVLLSRTLRQELEELATRVEHIELETHPRFFDFFVEGCQFVPIGAEVLQ